jgi:putative salt-induced outer membrane protein YdiY
MKKLLILVAALFTATPAMADTIQGAIGGSILNSDNTVVTGSFDYASKTPDSNWQRYLNLDYAYNDTKGMLLKNEFDSFAKIDYNLNNRNYLQSEARAEYNQLGKYKEKVVLGIGHGYRLIHTNKAKLSFETSAGITEAKGLSEFVVRESVWASYKFSANTHVDDKFLIEHGKSHDYIRNKASAVLDLSNHVFVSVTNIYTNDYTISKITSFNIGYKF